MGFMVGPLVANRDRMRLAVLPFNVGYISINFYFFAKQIFKFLFSKNCIKKIQINLSKYVFNLKHPKKKSFSLV